MSHLELSDIQGNTTGRLILVITIHIICQAPYLFTNGIGPVKEINESMIQDNFIFVPKHIHFGYSLELPHQCKANEYHPDLF